MSQEGRDQPLLLDMRKEVGEPGRVGVCTLVLPGVSTLIFQRPRELVIPLLTRGCPVTHTRLEQEVWLFLQGIIISRADLTV